MPDQATATAGTIVLYASGDGGWFGAAVDMFKQIARAGYPVVGFSSKAFLKIQRPHIAGSSTPRSSPPTTRRSSPTPARRSIRAMSSRVVLTGWSRGAAFSVLADPSRRRAIASPASSRLASAPARTWPPLPDDEATDDGQPSETGRPLAVR